MAFHLFLLWLPIYETVLPLNSHCAHPRFPNGWSAKAVDGCAIVKHFRHVFRRVRREAAVQVKVRVVICDLFQIPVHSFVAII